MVDHSTVILSRLGLHSVNETQSWEATVIMPDAPAHSSSAELAPVVATWDGDVDESTQMQIDALLAAESDINARLREGRNLEAADSSGKLPDALLADARRKRDQARRNVQQAQSRLSQVLKDRQASTKRLDKLQRAASQRVVIPDQLTLPSVALRSGADDAIAEEIKTLMRENSELEEAIARNDGARIHLEKLQNEKRDKVRQVKELKSELKMVQQQLEIKRAELEELEALVKPSPVRQAFQAEVDRLRREINASSSAKTHAEREASALAKRLLRVRTVLAPFLKTAGLKPQQSRPAADDELAGRLADYVLALAEKVRTLETTLGLAPFGWNLFGQQGSLSFTAGVLIWPIVFIALVWFAWLRKPGASAA
jgi:chromosome segregation ATPase